MQWKIDNTRPVYMQVEEYIRNAVLTGAYPPGAKIQPVRELAAELNVNPNTIQRAMAELEQQGLLIANGTLSKVVTDDQSIIDAIRQQAVQAAVNDCVANFKALGLSMTDVVQLLLKEE